MTIADRIQQLRKTKGLSQEELADKVGVSRQAVSKWESGQSVPDIDRISLLSNTFEVTTDYLIKGIEPKPENGRGKADARIFALAGTALNFIGFLTALLTWAEYQSPLSVLIGLLLMTIGVMIFFVGQYTGQQKEKAKKQFWTINIWLLAIIPYSCLFNFLQSIIGGYSFLLNPILTVGNSLVLYGFGWIFYLVICTLFCKLFSHQRQ